MQLPLLLNKCYITENMTGTKSQPSVIVEFHFIFQFDFYPHYILTSEFEKSTGQSKIVELFIRIC